MSAVPCCCPPDAQCVLDNAYNCRCTRTVVSSGPNVHSGTATTSGSVLQAVCMVLFIGVWVLCFSCCCLHNSSQEISGYSRLVHTTVYGTNGSGFSGSSTQTTTTTSNFAGDSGGGEFAGDS